MPVVELPFKPRKWQVPLINDTAKRITAVVHRRAGKSAGLMWRGIKRGLTIQRAGPPPRIIHALPFQVQWDRTGLWDRLAEAGRSIPGARVLASERRVILPNGAVYQGGGMDKPDSWRGGYADEIILDEFDDQQAEGQTTAILPMLADYDGTLVRSGTPKGFGRLKTAYDEATGEGASRYLLRWQDTGILDASVIDTMRREMTSEEFAQEFECSFDAPNTGAYYAKLMDDAERNGRVCNVPYEPRLPVTTGWDLGMDDATAIWFAQMTRAGEWRIIDYLEDAGADLAHYVGILRDKGYQYDRHILPHDVKVTEMGTGKSRIEVLQSLGLRNVKVVPSYPGALADGINAVKMTIPRCYFDQERTALGRKALWHYRREWQADRQVFASKPVHDQFSHAADAFRYLAVGGREARLDGPVRQRGGIARTDYATLG